jgi:predicted nicotinamide N-methyase
MLRCASLPDYCYRLRETREELRSGKALTISCLESLDRTIDDLFDILKARGTPEILETLCPYFGTVWPAARALTLELLEEDRLEGTRVLELGCGLAIPSIAAAMRGAETTATDCHPDIDAFLKINLAANGSPRVRYHSLDWRHAENLIELGKFDWVIASDVLYEKHQPRIVAQVIAATLAKSGRFILADPGRPYLQEFSDEMSRLGYKVIVQTRTVADPGAELPAVEGRTRDVFILKGGA